MSPSPLAPSRIGSLLAVALLTLTGFAAAQGQPKPGGTYEVAYDLSPFTLDAMADTISAKSHIVDNVQEALFAPDAGLVARPMLVDRWTVSPDGLTWTFVLRKSVPFHNGEILKADDVVASLRRWLGRDGTWAPHIKSRLESLDRVDDLTVRMKLSKPFGAMLEALSMVEGVQPVIFPKSVLDRYPGDKDRVKEEDVVGTGPYKLVSWERDRRIVLARFDRYAARKEPLSGFSGNKTAYFDRVHHNFVPEAAGRVAGALTGRYDLAINLPLDQMAQIKGNPAVVAQVNPYGGRTELTFNSTIAPFDTKAMRQAVANVLEPEEMLAAIAPKGLYTVNSSPFFPNQSTWVSKIGFETYRKRDLKKARELITSAGLTPPVAITVISVPVSMPGGRQIQVAVQQLEESKLFKVDLQIMDWTVMVQKRWEKKHNAMYNAFNVWYQNDLVAPTWNNPQHPASGFLASPARDELLERRLQTTSAAEIARIRDDFHRWFWDEVPLFPFGNFATLDTVGPHVKGSQHIGGPIYFGVWFDGKK